PERAHHRAVADDDRVAVARRDPVEHCAGPDRDRPEGFPARRAPAPPDRGVVGVRAKGVGVRAAGERAVRALPKVALDRHRKPEHLADDRGALPGPAVRARDDAPGGPPGADPLRGGPDLRPAHVGDRHLRRQREDPVAVPLALAVAHQDEPRHPAADAFTRSISWRSRPKCVRLNWKTRRGRPTMSGSSSPSTAPGCCSIVPLVMMSANSFARSATVSSATGRLRRMTNRRPTWRDEWYTRWKPAISSTASSIEVVTLKSDMSSSEMSLW